jgi:hypothetical protein
MDDGGAGVEVSDFAVCALSVYGSIIKQVQVSGARWLTKLSNKVCSMFS